MDDATPCVLCAVGESENGRFVWEDRHWRLWTHTTGPIPGYSFLNSKRHIPYITDLDGEEAASLGVVLPMLTRAVRDATGGMLVYLHVFGDGAAHLHIHLVPHAPGDALLTDVVRPDTAEAPMGALRETADRIARALGTM